MADPTIRSFSRYGLNSFLRGTALPAMAAGSLLLASCQEPLNNAADQAGDDVSRGELALGLALNPGSYSLQAVHSGKCVDVVGLGTADGANIQQATCTGAANQQWALKDLGNGVYEMKGVQSGKCADVGAWSTSNGGNILQWSCHGGNNQKWVFTDLGSGQYQLKSVHSGKCLDVSGISTADGANIHQWTCHTMGNQKFKLIPTATLPPDTTKPVPPNPTWRQANLTWYTSYPDPGSEECIEFNGCTWEGQFAALPGKQPESWVKANNIIAVHEKDFTRYKLKTFRLKQGTRTIDAKVYDMCSDSDCDGCCTENAGAAGFLIDVEKYTAERFGTNEGVVDWTCLDCAP